MGMSLLRKARVAVLVTVALAVGVCTGPGAARAAQAPIPARPVAAVSARKIEPVTPPGLAPCTKPLLGPVRHCESTSPIVDRWFNANAAGSECTLGFTIDWGDRTRDWTGTLTDPSPGEHLLDSHKYPTSKTVVSYTITVYIRVIAGPCTGSTATVFGFTYMPPVNAQQWWKALAAPACAGALAPKPAEVGLTLLELGQILGAFPTPEGWWGIAFKVGVLTLDGIAVYLVLFDAPKKCMNKAYSLGPLPHALAYGASHPGKLFQPKAGTVKKVPQITSVSTYTKGVLDYVRLTYTDPGNDAKGFGFVGINGAGWAEENHPFTAPSYGIVGKDQIDYPFNLLCGTASHYSSAVEAWIYNSQGVRSYPVRVALNCT